MLSIPSTLSLHRATRALYLDAARRAQRDNHQHRDPALPVFAKHYATGEIVLLKRYVSSLRAFLYFLRRARLANHKLVAVKRFAREYELTQIRLKHFGDDSVWGDL